MRVASWEELLSLQRPWVIAHRGFSARYPENTLTAFTAALDAGADAIELDVTLTGDAVPVVLHDDRVDRTTDGEGLVAYMAAESVTATGGDSPASAWRSGALEYQRPRRSSRTPMRRGPRRLHERRLGSGLLTGAPGSAPHAGSFPGVSGRVG